MNYVYCINRCGQWAWQIKAENCIIQGQYQMLRLFHNAELL